ncbi:MAG: hypothetical protein SOR38_07300 [Oscillospiraceae bacterium]|nr:hypothetical protein [Oscillospiraceae bacterium]MDY3065597.1 hypothetical protein [Oscillospiraceae bacterium]
MTLITCSADCVYQEDGYCQLDGGAPVCTVMMDCCHYKKRTDYSGVKGTTNAAASSGGI